MMLAAKPSVVSTRRSLQRHSHDASLLDKGIATRRGIICSHREPPYSCEKQFHDLRQSEAALPFYPASDLHADDKDELQG
jgi:hypothetical protein